MGSRLQTLTVRITPSVVAVLVAALIAVLFDLGIAFARGWHPEVGYTLSMALLSLAAALVVGAVGGLLRPGPVLAVALWAGLTSALGLLLFSTGSVTLAVAVTLLTFGCAVALERAGLRAPVIGVAVAAALSLAGQMLGRLLPALGVDRPVGFVFDALLLLVMLAIMLGAAAYQRLTAARRFAPPLGPALLVLLACVVALVPLTVGGTTTQARVHDDSPPRSAATAKRSTDKPNILVLILDTVRADHTTLYGYARDTTPFLARFAKEGGSVVYPRAYAPASWTLPSHASLFTGELPSAHGLHGGGLRDLRNPSDPDFRLHAPLTLAELMVEQGYRTGAILSNVHVTLFQGMSRGFEQWVNPPAVGAAVHVGEMLRKRLLGDWYAHLIKPYAPARTINREILRFIDQCADTACFVVGNYMEAHSPYHAAPRYHGRFAGSSSADRYDEELLDLDAALSELFAALEQRGGLQNTWVVITSDHGESFNEHGAHAHGTSLYEEQVKVPMLVRPPAGVTLPEHDGPVGLLDVSTTVAAIARGPAGPPFGSGRDLRKPQAAGMVQLEFFGNVAEPMAQRKPARSVVSRVGKLIEHRKVADERFSRMELFDLDRDPKERHDLASSQLPLVQQLRPHLPLLSVEPTGVGGAKQSDASERVAGPSEDQLQQLKALGYVQ